MVRNQVKKIIERQIILAFGTNEKISNCTLITMGSHWMVLSWKWPHLIFVLKNHSGKLSGPHRRKWSEIEIFTPGPL